MSEPVTNPGPDAAFDAFVSGLAEAMRRSLGMTFEELSADFPAADPDVAARWRASFAAGRRWMPGKAWIDPVVGAQGPELVALPGHLHGVRSHNGGLCLPKDQA